MRDGQRDLAPGALDHAALEPAGARRRMGRDHQLVGGELAQGVLDRRGGLVVIADVAAGVDARVAHRRQRSVEPRAGVGERPVDVRGPVLQCRGREGRDDDHHLGRAVRAAPPDLLQQRPAADRLVGHDQDPVHAVVGAGDLSRTRQSPARAAKREPKPRAQLEREHDRPGQRIDYQRHRDHDRRADPDDHDQPEHLGLGAERVMHGSSFRGGDLNVVPSAAPAPCLVRRPPRTGPAPDPWQQSWRWCPTPSAPPAAPTYSSPDE